MSKWSNTEVDTTILVVGGLILAHIVVIGLLVLHIQSDDETELLSPEMLMAILNLPISIIAYGVGKRSGENGKNGIDLAKEREKMRQELLDEIQQELEKEQTND